MLLSDAVSAAAAAGVVVDARGRIGDQERECAQAMIAAVLAYHKLTDGARVRLTGANRVDGPVLVQVNLRVGEARARVQVPGRDAARAIAASVARLERQIRRLSTAWEPWPWPDPERRSLGVPGRGRVARVKTIRLHVAGPGQATAAMNAMDYDFHLFTDAETGEDAVVYRAGPTGVRLARQRSMRPPVMPLRLSLTVNARQIPTLDTARAVDRLAEGWLPFVFFTDRDSGRGNVLYRRYDGDLALIKPA